MLITAQEAVLMEQDEDLASSTIGGLWDNFKKTIPTPQAKILVHAFNLILLADPGDSPTVEEDATDDTESLDFDSMMGRPTSFLPVQMTNLLLDETMTTSQRKLAVYEVLIDNIMYLLKTIGFTIDEDLVTAESLPYLCKIGHFFFDMQGYQDLIGIGNALEAADIGPVDRFLLVMHRYLGEEANMEPYECLIEDVSEVTLKAIKDGLEGEDVTVGIPNSIIIRVKANLTVLEGTLAYTHVRNNGQLGGSVDSFINFFHKELSALQEDLQGDNAIAYLKELIGFYLIGDVNTPQIKDRLLAIAYEMIDSHLVLVNAEALINSLVLTDE